MDTIHGIQMCDLMTVTRYDTALGRSKHSLCYMHGCHLQCLAASWVGTVGTPCGVPVSYTHLTLPTTTIV